jgi:hypothetical protein
MTVVYLTSMGIAQSVRADPSVRIFWNYLRIKNEYGPQIDPADDKLLFTLPGNSEISLYTSEIDSIVAASSAVFTAAGDTVFFRTFDRAADRFYAHGKGLTWETSLRRDEIVRICIRRPAVVACPRCGRSFRDVSWKFCPHDGVALTHASR